MGLQKDVFSWEIDGINKTICLPASKVKKICRQLQQVLRKQQVCLGTFQELCGRLQHASFGTAEGTGLFSPIQQAMAGNPPFITIASFL